MAYIAPPVLTNRRTVLFITILASFLIPFIGSSIIIALPLIGDEFGFNVIALSWVNSAYILASASLLVPFGRLADIYGRRRIFLGGNIVFALGCIISVVIDSGNMLLLSRVIQGIGGSAIFSTSIAILTSAYPPNERGKVLGINTAAVYIGLSAGPVIGGLMTAYWGWKSIFIFCGAISLLVIMAIITKLRTESAVSKERFDLTGMVIYILVLVCLVYGLSEIPNLAGYWLIGAGITGALIFYRWEVRNPTPLINFRFFTRNRGFAFSNLAALINYSGVWAVSFVLSLFLQEIKGFSAESAGIVLVSSPLIQAVFSPVFGRLSDRIEPRFLASAGMGITAAGIAMLVFLSPETPVYYIVIALLLLGFGLALFASPNTNAIMSSVDRQHYGFASATLATMRQLGMMLSMGIVMVIFSVVMGRVQITPASHTDFVTSTHIIFAIASFSCFSAIFASLARGNIHPGASTNISTN